MAKKAVANKNKLKKSVQKNVKQVKSSKNKNIKSIKGKAKTKTPGASVKTKTASTKVDSKKVLSVKSPAKNIKPAKKAIPLKKQAILKPEKAAVKPAPKVADKVKAVILPAKKTGGKASKEPKLPQPVQPRRNVYAFPTKSPNHDPKVKKNEPPGKFEIEYVVHTSPGILYEFLTSPSGLSEWFADDVNIKHGIYTFYWDGMQQDARVLAVKEFKYVRYQWVDKQDGSYFEFRIEIDEMTNDVSFIVTDFAEGAEIVTSRLLWDSQVHKLLQVIGAY